MKVLAYFGHPAQYHFLKFTIKNLMADGHQVKILIKSKDMLEQLLQEDGLAYENIQPVFRKNNKVAILYASMQRAWEVMRIAAKFRPDVFVGTDSSLAQVGWLMHKPVLTTLEDDVEIIKNLAKLTYPFTTHIMVPNVCRVGKWEAKKIGYDGYMKLAYLHPQWFQPSEKIVNQYKLKTPFVLIRLAKLMAHHDTNIKGLNIQILRNTIAIAEKNKYQVYISSEIELDKEFEKYRLAIKHTDIHHIMNEASLLVSDSQSMSVEAAILGVPSLRFSDFSGRISVLEELEHKYGLTFGIKTDAQEELYRKMEEFLTMPNLRAEFHARRQRMLADKIDVTAFLTWFIENYPASAKEAKNANEDFWKKFK